MTFYVLNQVMSKRGKLKIQKFSKLQGTIKISKIVIIQHNNKKDMTKQSSFQVKYQRDQLLELKLLQHTLNKLKKSVKSQNHIEILIKRVGR
jgi:hypothetical protein